MFPLPRMLEYGNIKPILKVTDRQLQVQYTNMMVLVNGNLYGYGQNLYGQLGIGNNTAQNTITLCKTGVKRFFLGANGSIAIGIDDKIYWAGRDLTWPEVGYKTTWFDVTNVLKQYGITASNIKKCSIGTSLRILTTNGDFYYCGVNSYAECGVTTPNIQKLTLSTLTNIKEMSAYLYGTHFVLNDGSALFCGQNAAGEGGLGSTTQINSPTQVTTGVRDIMALYEGTQWFMENGDVYYSGKGNYGKTSNPAGTNTTIITKNTSYPVISAGDNLVLNDDLGNSSASLAMVSFNNNIYESGNNAYGQLGKGTIGGANQLSIYPLDIVQSLGFDNIKDFYAGAWYNIILTNDGKLYACGGSPTVAWAKLPDGSSNIPTMTLMANMPWY